MTAIGNLVFYTTECPSFFNQVAEIPIEFNKKFTLLNTSIKSIAWNYPSHVMIRFYRERDVKPYATITGPTSMRFKEEFCSFESKYHSVQVLTSPEITSDSNIFLDLGSYFVVTAL